MEDKPLEQILGDFKKQTETVLFHGYELCRNDYEALQELARAYFDSSAEDYFQNVTELNKPNRSENSARSNVYIHIKDKKVVRLNISSVGLKEIPKQIQKLSCLQTLVLDHNKIEKIYNLEYSTELYDLNLSYNQISRIENLNSLTRLAHLSLQANRISRIENLDNLTRLTGLNLESNRVSSIENLDNQTRLTVFILADNRINKIKNLDKQTELRYLYLNDNKISRIENLDSQTKLKVLNLSTNRISRIENLDNLKALTELTLSHNQISKIENLYNQIGLETLLLDHNNIRKIENLYNQQGLKHLSLMNNNNIRKAENLGHLKQLQPAYFLKGNPLFKSHNKSNFLEFLSYMSTPVKNAIYGVIQGQALTTFCPSVLFNTPFAGKQIAKQSAFDFEGKETNLLDKIAFAFFNVMPMLAGFTADVWLELYFTIAAWDSPETRPYAVGYLTLKGATNLGSLVYEGIKRMKNDR
ncbi:leucine-rich repeat domain-containing protein [Candidatus Woesearchaeota archaeon]|nr:leucine-rich repeat domain-containing protein [Candidatus Woesearchaeota archaeon]